MAVNDAYSLAQLQALRTAIRAHFDNPAANPMPGINHERMYLSLFDAIKDLRQRVAALEAGGP